MQFCFLSTLTSTVVSPSLCSDLEARVYIQARSCRHLPFFLTEMARRGLGWMSFLDQWELETERSAFPCAATLNRRSCGSFSGLVSAPKPGWRVSSPPPAQRKGIFSVPSKCRTWHLALLKLTQLASAHQSSLSRSLCRAFPPSSRGVPFPPNLVSSANLLREHSIPSSRSLIKMLNKYVAMPHSNFCIWGVHPQYIHPQSFYSRAKYEDWGRGHKLTEAFQCFSWTETSYVLHTVKHHWFVAFPLDKSIWT